MAKKRPKRLKNRVFFIRRDSALDDTLYFCDEEDRRVFFDKAIWCSALMTTFQPEQNAHVVCLKKEPDDVSFREWIAPMLEGTGLSVDQYLAAIEQNVKVRRKATRRRQ